LIFRRTDTNGTRSGSAMLVVLLMLGTIAVFAAIVARSVSGAALELRAARDSVAQQADLRAGIDLGVAAIRRLGDDVRVAAAEVDLPERRIVVRATNERARIDLNLADAPALTALLKSLGIDEKEASALADNVIDWRTSANENAQQTVQQTDIADHFGEGPHALSGVSMPGSTGPGSQTSVKQKPAARFFLHPAQLVSVAGFSEALVKSIFPLITVASGSKKVDPFIASAAVLNALPESTTNKVEGFIEARNGNTSPDTSILLLGLAKELLTSDAAVGWRLQITSTERNGRVHHSEAVVAVPKDGSEPYRVLYIIDDPALLS
jgi:type II secretory pathway component PulK